MKKSTPKVVKQSKETLVAFILDKSGSMGVIASATRSGFNEYIGDLQKDKKGSYSISLTLFDTLVDKRHVNTPIGKVEKLTKVNYIPSGMTALYDAAMQTIDAAEKSAKKGQKVLCIIMTDGEENSSVEYKAADLKKKIKELEGKGNWSFVFLGANQDSWQVGGNIGISAMNTANYNATAGGAGAGFATMSANTRAFGGNDTMATSSFFSKSDQDNLGKAG